MSHREVNASLTARHMLLSPLHPPAEAQKKVWQYLFWIVLFLLLLGFFFACPGSTIYSFSSYFLLPSGSPSLSGTGTVTVLVNDVNDNVPVFTSSTFHTTIMEDAPTGTDVLLVNSSDADVGANGVIR